MDEYRDYIEENRPHWDELAEHHPDTDHYDVEAFLAGESTLRRLEREELDAAGKGLLHLQCHSRVPAVRSPATNHAIAASTISAGVSKAYSSFAPIASRYRRVIGHQ